MVLSSSIIILQFFFSKYRQPQAGRGLTAVWVVSDHGLKF